MSPRPLTENPSSKGDGWRIFLLRGGVFCCRERKPAASTPAMQAPPRCDNPRPRVVDGTVATLDDLPETVGVSPEIVDETAKTPGRFPKIVDEIAETSGPISKTVDGIAKFPGPFPKTVDEIAETPRSFPKRIDPIAKTVSGFRKTIDPTPKTVDVFGKTVHEISQTVDAPAERIDDFRPRNRPEAAPKRVLRRTQEGSMGVRGPRLLTCDGQERTRQRRPRPPAGSGSCRMAWSPHRPETESP